MQKYNQAIGILGIWLLITTLFSGESLFIIWSNTLVGLLTAVFGFNTLDKHVWGGIVSLAVAIWLIHSFYFISDLSSNMVVLNNIICGLLLSLNGYLSQRSSDLDQAQPA